MLHRVIRNCHRNILSNRRKYTNLTQHVSTIGPKARDIIERDERVISASYPRAAPLVIDHAKGSEVWDVDGKRYLDFHSGIAVTSTGHSHPEVVKAIQEQVTKFLHISSDFWHSKFVELGEKLNEIAPFEEDAKVFLGNSGAEAVEAALKLARYHTKRPYFIGFTNGFHGRTMGALSFTASKSKYHKHFGPLLPGIYHVPYPNTYRPILACNQDEDYGEAVVRFIESQILATNVPPEEVAAVLVETLQGEGGYVVPPPKFFPALRNLCDKYGILLICDEVQCGMGRTGKWWAIEHFDVEPDIVVSAKGIASGVPLSACIARKSVMDWSSGTHGNTYGGNPIACTASLKTIELIQKQYLQNAADMGSYAIDGLKQIMSKHRSIGDVRGIGLFIGVEFVKDKNSKEPDHKLRDRVEALAFEKGLLLLGCSHSVIRICPALSINKQEIDEGLRIFDEVVSIAENE